jgi:hypothetical protein
VIGRVEFTEGGMTREAILDDNGRWICEAVPQVAEELNKECAPTGDPSEECWGYAAMIKAAQRLKGFAWLGPARTQPP